ncbi:MAG: helix-turn-helix domain-containing protein [Flavobacteriaceae bacterium]
MGFSQKTNIFPLAIYALLLLRLLYNVSYAFLQQRYKINRRYLIALTLGVHYATVQRWLKRYKERGIEHLLSPLTRNKPSKFITPEIHQALESRLRDGNNPFSGYVEVQQWLLDTYQIKIGYKWLWAYMRAKMGARLKVPRKTNIKKEQDAEISFFKTAR